MVVFSGCVDCCNSGGAAFGNTTTSRVCFQKNLKLSFWGAYVCICMQVEFYFSDTNLPTDHHLMKYVKKDPQGFGAC